MALHTQLVDLPEGERGKIGTVLESLVERARRRLREEVKLQPEPRRPPSRKEC